MRQTLTIPLGVLSTAQDARSVMSSVVHAPNSLLSNCRPRKASKTSLSGLAQPRMATKRTQVETETARASEQLKKDKDVVLSRDEHASVCIIARSSKSQSKTEFIKHVGARSASADPKELFLPRELNGKKQQLLQGARMAKARAGACAFHGPGWIPKIVICLNTVSAVQGNRPAGGKLSATKTRQEPASLRIW